MALQKLLVGKGSKKKLASHKTEPESNPEEEYREEEPDRISGRLQREGPQVGRVSRQVQAMNEGVVCA